MASIDLIQDLAVVMLLAGLSGWACYRVGLPVVTGYLLAGMLAGPRSPLFSLVGDPESIQTLAYLGLVFLMFSLGMRLNIRKLRRLGAGLPFATFVGSLIMFNFARLAAAAYGWSAREGLFLAGMLMVSSSAIVMKILQDTDAKHERVGQLAQGIAVVEDVIAVFMLTLLSSLVQFGDGAAARATGILWNVGAFVVVAGLIGLLVLPWLLRKLSFFAGDELHTILVAGLLLGLAILAQRAGYSLALGAYLLGAIVAETQHRAQTERSFEGTRDIFSAVFFVSIGMQIDVHTLGQNWLPILTIGALTIAGRTFASATGMVAIGTPGGEALRVGLSVTPIGEFSFIIALLGVEAGVVPPRFYPIAVGVSLITTVVSPMLMRRADALSDRLSEIRPRWLQTFERTYHRWLERARERERSSHLWQLSKKRFIQIGIEALLVTGVIVFSGQFFSSIQSRLNPNWLFPHGPEVLFWLILVILILAPLVAIWRNISAMALLYAQVTAAGQPNETIFSRTIETGVKMVGGLFIYLWLSAILPAHESIRWLILAFAAVAIVSLAILWRRLIFWHSHLEVELQSILANPELQLPAASLRWLRPFEQWDVNVSECTIPDLADCRGNALGEINLRKRFGCTVVGLERQGFMIPQVTVETRLYPRDRVLLLGTPAQISNGKRILTQVSEDNVSASLFEEMRMEAIRVPSGCPYVDSSLAEIDLLGRAGVQVVGIHRHSYRILNPGGTEKLFAGDEILVIGAPAQLDVAKELLRRA